MRKFLTVLCFCCLAAPLFAQRTVRRPRPFISEAFYSIQMDMPNEKMRPAVRNNMGDKGFGLAASFMANPYTWGRNKRNSPLRIGGELGYTYYGRFKQSGIKASTGMIHLTAMARLHHEEAHRLMPFFDIFAGGNFYMASFREDVNAIESIAGLEPSSFASMNSASFVHGAAVGVFLGQEHPEKMRLQLRFAYTRGTAFKYVERNSMVVVNNGVYVLIGKVPVDYFSIQIGLGNLFTR